MKADMCAVSFYPSHKKEYREVERIEAERRRRFSKGDYTHN
jgi:hypothetical protein